MGYLCRFYIIIQNVFAIGFCYYLFIRILVNPLVLVGLINSWSMYSSYVFVLSGVFLFLNLVSWVLEAVCLYSGSVMFE